MPFERPSLSQITKRVRQDLKVDDGLRVSVEAVLAQAIAGASHTLHGHIDWASRQLFPTTGDADVVLRWASLFGLERKAASPARGRVRFDAQPGSVVPEGTLVRTSDGRQYRVRHDSHEGGGAVETEVIAVDAGAAGNAPSGVAVSLVSPIAGVSSGGETIGDGLVDGEDVESIDALLQRLLQRVREETRGGGPGDYVRWALEVGGVTRAWQYPLLMGPGTVGVAFVTDGQESIIPSPEKVAEVQAHIDERRPVTADVHVFAPVTHVVAFEVSITPDTPDLRTAVEAELRWALSSRAVPGGTVLRSLLLSAFASVDGLDDYELLAPVANITPAAGHIAVPGDFDWGD